MISYICEKVWMDIAKNSSGKYSQKIIADAQQSATDALKTTSQRVIQKTAEATGDMIGNKITDVVAKLFNHKNKSLKDFTTEYIRDRRYSIQ